MIQFDLGLLQEALPTVTAQDVFNMANSGRNLDNRVAVWVDNPLTATPAEVNDFYDRQRVLKNPNLKWNNLGPDDLKSEAEKEALRRMYGMNVNAGGQPMPKEGPNTFELFLPHHYDNRYYPNDILDPYIHYPNYDDLSDRGKSRAKNLRSFTPIREILNLGQPTGGAAPVTQENINDAYMKTIKNKNLATNGKRLRDIYNQKILRDYGEVPTSGRFDDGLVRNMIQSGMLGDYTKW